MPPGNIMITSKRLREHTADKDKLRKSMQTYLMRQHKLIEKLLELDENSPDENSMSMQVIFWRPQHRKKCTDCGPLHLLMAVGQSIRDTFPEYFLPHGEAPISVATSISVNDPGRAQSLCSFHVMSMRKEFPIAFRMKCCIAGLALEKWNLNSAPEAWSALDDSLLLLQDAIMCGNVSPPPPPSGPPPATPRPPPSEDDMSAMWPPRADLHQCRQAEYRSGDIPSWKVVSSDSKECIADATYALRDPCLAKEVVLHHTTNWLRLEENSIVVGLTECMYIVRGVSSEHRPCAE